MSDSAAAAPAESIDARLKGLAVGRIVHYRDYAGALHAAIVASVTHKPYLGCVRLVVFGALDGDSPTEMTAATRFSDSPVDLNTWQWPAKL